MISECRNRIKKNAQDAKAECFLCIFLFLYRKRLVSYKAKNVPRGCASRVEEVSCKQHRSSAKESQATLCSVV